MTIGRGRSGIVAFGDLVDPPASELTFPVSLPLGPAVVHAYPIESVIAEKFDAMVVLGIANSRMKDFFDILTLARSHHFDLEQHSLKCAARANLEFLGGSLEADSSGLHSAGGSG